MHNIALMNKDTGKVFYKGMGYKFFELPNFDKQKHELKSDLDKWLYLLKNLSRLDKIPDFLDKRVFQKIFKIAEVSEVSKLMKEQRELYELVFEALNSKKVRFFKLLNLAPIFRNIFQNINN